MKVIKCEYFENGLRGAKRRRCVERGKWRQTLKKYKIFTRAIEKEQRCVMIKLN